jgi:hypothetical protein
MRCVISTTAMLLLLTASSLADADATHFKIGNGEIVVAQSSCGICANNRTSCQLGCNGAGTCIQACDVQYRECHRQNFCGRR